MEISQHDPKNSWSTCSMRMNEVAKFQYKFFEVAMLQEKSNPAIDERVMPQYTSSYQDSSQLPMLNIYIHNSWSIISKEKSTINERSMSQCGVSSRVIAYPIKVLSNVAMSYCKSPHSS